MLTKNIFLRLIICICLLIIVSFAHAQVPGAPGPVTAASGSAVVLPGSTANYFVNAASGATSYTWFLSNTGAGTVTAFGTSASVQWSTSFTGQVYLICTAVNSSGSTGGTALSIQALISGTISPTLQTTTTPTVITSSAPSGNGVYSYQWQSSVNNSTWTAISGATASSYRPQYQNSPTYYRLATTCGTVTAYSNNSLVTNMVSNSYSSSNSIVSVNKLTGTANVVIPLYTIAAAHTTFPINLVYSATGVKGSDVEQNAGMGWQVSLGGAITRQMRGFPDDVSNYIWEVPITCRGWLYNNNEQIISSLTFANSNNAPTCANENSDMNLLGKNFTSYTDTEPDIFQVNAPGLSCQLVFDQSIQAFRVIPYQDLKVSYTTGASSTNQGPITSFTITNDKGVTYTFAAPTVTTQQAVQTLSNGYKFTGESFLQCYQTYLNTFVNPITYNSSWSLTSISDVHNNRINIAYTPGPAIIDTISTQVNAVGTLLNLFATLSTTTPQLVSSINCTNNMSGQSQAFNINYVSTPSSQRSCISSITGLGHDFVFGYNNVVSGSNYTRLFLNGIVDNAQNVNGQTLAANSYTPLSLTFNYQSTTSTTSTLASPTANNVDYWGYTNGNTSNTSLLPTIDINPATPGYERYRNRQTTPSPSTVYTYNIAGANREADINCIAGTLTQINYPAGGYTALSYAPNQYYDGTIQADVRGGGIRVKQVLDNDGIPTDNNFIKSYSYTNSLGLSSGKALSLPTFAFTTPYVHSYTGQALWDSTTVVSPVDLSGEDHSILYTSVTETINNGGSTVYGYAVPATNWDPPIASSTGVPAWNQTTTLAAIGTEENGNCWPLNEFRNDVNTYPFPPNTNYDFERGLLTTVAAYNNTGTQVSETDYTYQTPETPVDITALKFDVNGWSGEIVGTNYATYTIHTSAGPLLSKVVNTVFDLTNVASGAQPQSTTPAQVVTTNNVYNTAWNKLSQQNVHNSDGSINTLNIQYVKDYNINTALPADPNTTNLLALQNANLNIPVETYTQFTPVNGTPVTTGAELTLFGTFANQGADQLSLQPVSGTKVWTATFTPVSGTAPQQRKKFVSASGVTNFTPSSVVSSSGTNTFQWDMTPNRYVVTENDLAYDATGLLLSKDDGFQHIKTTIYDNFSTFRLRAALTNARFDQIGLDFPWGYSRVSILGGTIDYLFSPNPYNFSVASNSPVSNIAASTVTRNGESALALPAFEVLAKTVNNSPIVKNNPSPKNYIFSIWVNATTAGSISVSATDGVNTVTAPLLGFAQTVGNPAYPTGFEYCRAVIPMASLTASTNITISFSSNQNINVTDMFTYPDIANLIMYSYDSYGNKISETDGNGISTYYSYDGLGRLLYIYDQDNNIIEQKTYVNNK